ncbi:MAG: hypothetical protein HPY90_13290 [Syntrophothermus sp.]|uniref:hypothetical protein n=1 Tax=Syntrophothermus sp. TaxID=2736299 RepID=UPI00257B657E|nr:hypothetical protein [Syntrophothermus sp.]NSW84223.1 hypothetical protein [Syntrophothermus sp.]
MAGQLSRPGRWERKDGATATCTRGSRYTRLNRAMRRRAAVEDAAFGRAVWTEGNESGREAQNGTGVLPWYHNLSQAHEVAELLWWVTSLCNDVAHCAMKRQPGLPASIRERTKQLVRCFDGLLTVSILTCA